MSTEQLFSVRGLYTLNEEKLHYTYHKLEPN